MAAVTTLRVYLLAIGDILIIMISSHLAQSMHAPKVHIGDLNISPGTSVGILVLYMIIFYIFNLYDIRQKNNFYNIALRIALSVCLTSILLSFLCYVLSVWQYDQKIFITQVVLVCAFLIFWRLIYSLFFPLRNKTKVVILGAGNCGQALLQLLQKDFSPYQVVGFLDDDQAKQNFRSDSVSVLGPISALPRILATQNAKLAILAITHDRPATLIRHILEARLNGVTILEMPSVYESLTQRIPVDYIYDQWLLFGSGFYLVSQCYVQRTKRLIDLVISLFLLIITSPLLLLTSLAIWCDSRGPIFYKQTRVGKGGAEFILWKFRSMYENAETNGAVWAVEEDPRVTRVGKIIRILRIDELPQLINVFRGDMSLIGPRPERPEFVQKLKCRIPYYMVRHIVKPGITGWAQVNYRYASTIADAKCKLEYDLYYIKNMSLLLDIKILLQTIGVILLGQGAR